MELNLETDFADRAYQLLVSLVVPRPIALVTTVSPDGKINAAPFSFFNVLGANPPICAFAPADRANGVPKDTALNVRATHEFVVNLVDEAIAEKMNLCAASLPYGENELLHAGLTSAPSTSVETAHGLPRPRPVLNVPSGARCKSAKTAWSSASSSAYTSAMSFMTRRKSGS